MILTIKVEDQRERSYLPDGVLKTVLSEPILDFIGLKVLEMSVERGPDEKPESKDEDWK